VDLRFTMLGFQQPPDHRGLTHLCEKECEGGVGFEPHRRLNNRPRAPQLGHLQRLFGHFGPGLTRERRPDLGFDQLPPFGIDRNPQPLDHHRDAFHPDCEPRHYHGLNREPPHQPCGFDRNPYHPHGFDCEPHHLGLN
jgi:hypothetical protein